LLLATIAQQYRLSLLPGQKIVPAALITMSPEFGLKMRVERREVTEQRKVETASPHLVPA
jgi:hypothetical protein